MAWTDEERKELAQVGSNIALMGNKLETLEKTVYNLADTIKAQTIQFGEISLIKLELSVLTKLVQASATKDELKPIKAIVYGAVGMVLSSVFGAIIFLVVKGGLT